MGYLWAFINYCKTEKVKRDIMDYIRAVIIIGATMAVVRIMIDTIMQ